jgi:serine palmitoyltransferase
MLYHPGKIAAFGQRTLERGIAAVVVGFPATPLLTSRARICISASHTKADLDRAIAALNEVADECAIKYSVG